MDPIEILRQFKNIEPNRDYAKKSRLLILRGDKPIPPGFWKLFLKNIEFAGAIALTGILIFMILGGFSAWKITSPVANLDPAGLKAEAQAIDIQIELTNLNYAGGAQSKSAESTPATPSQGAAPKTDSSPTSALPENSGVQTENQASGTPISIDEALQGLSE